MNALVIESSVSCAVSSALSCTCSCARCVSNLAVLISDLYVLGVSSMIGGSVNIGGGGAPGDNEHLLVMVHKFNNFLLIQTQISVYLLVVNTLIALV